MEIHYINTDLEIESKEDLNPIIEAFGKNAFVLHHGPIEGLNHASFELSVMTLLILTRSLTGIVILLKIFPHRPERFGMTAPHASLTLASNPVHPRTIIDLNCSRGQLTEYLV
jgi:hypothetical protein